MKRFCILFCWVLLGFIADAQKKMTPEILWSLHRVTGEAVSKDGKYVYYSSKSVDWKSEKSSVQHYKIGVEDGVKKEFTTTAGKTITQRYDDVWYAFYDNVVYKSTDAGTTWTSIFTGANDAENVWVAPNGKFLVYSKRVLVQPTMGPDIYDDLPNATAQVYTDLNDRHWDSWGDGKYSHLFIVNLKDGSAKDILAEAKYDCPTKPFGGLEDLVWSPDSRGFVYVCKKKEGKEYATSTNTDLYFYDVNNGKTENWTEGMMGYDTNPAFSKDGKKLAWTSMATDGYEADKNDVVVMDVYEHKRKINLTAHWDGTVNSFIWGKNDGTGESRYDSKIFFTAPTEGTEQLFEVAVPFNNDAERASVKQITKGKWDVSGIVGQAGSKIIVTRCDMNHANEIYAVKPNYGDMISLTGENDGIYKDISMSETVLKKIKLKDGYTMGEWIIYPPDFDPNKKYPALLYCQGGPQSALSQFYSIRWNFQLMAAQGYIIIAPNRRGMPGWGVKWNEDISKDWGGNVMRDYLAAIDDATNYPYVDKSRLGCVGASYGGYSVFMLAGMHENRFKTFIAHDGVFDLKSWYGTTEEVWFPNWDLGGAFWKNPAPQAYEKFNPINYVNKWNTPIMIVQGGLDFRVPIEQGLEAFQAARLHDVKAKLLYLPNENHWVLHPQNGIAWQREFFKWLDETLK